MKGEFVNEPIQDFSKPEIKAKMKAALDGVAASFGAEYPLVIGGEKITLNDKIKSVNPAKPDEVIGIFQKAGEAEAAAAVEAAARAFELWRWMPPGERADVLFRAAAILRRRRDEMNAWMVYEVGKNWIEADADTAEGIDFLEFYGREMLRLAAEQPLTRIPSEDNRQEYIPLGVCVIIPPWNFPCAILLGMTTAALVAGNTVVLKPSSDAPAVGRFFFEIMEEAGLPKGVLNFVTGGGRTAGRAMVEHPKTRLIAFTGSKGAGLDIVERASKTAPGQIWIKRVIAEMGGKDFIIVDEDVDMDAAVANVVASAFGFQGQKCSACSRAIVHEAAYDEFLKRVVQRVKTIKVGPTKDFDHYLGPVINKAAFDSIMEYIRIGKDEGKCLTGGEKAGGDGFFIQPTVIADVAPTARIAQEEIFGPVMAVIKAKDIDEAIEISNNTEYGLTGSIYSRDRKNIDKAKRLCHAGNFYVNRKCTGALVGAHPFGGFNMSGTDSKAGGRDYLLLFTQAKLISEQF
jgi:1-pyrroline-5-carboxylate dehydrogenase